MKGCIINLQRSWYHGGVPEIEGLINLTFKILGIVPSSESKVIITLAIG